MDVRLLGPLEVDFGERVIVEAPKQRGVLETLAISADTGVSPATLIEAIWGDAPPRTAGASLQSHVSRLRQLLPEGTITTDGHGYRLNVDPDDVDIHRFERFVIAGGQALVVGVDPGTGERRLRLPDPTRTYADSIPDPDDRATARRRHAEWFRQVMVSAGAEMVGERDVDWSKRLARDDANIRTALDWWMEHDPVRALVFANGFGRASSLHTDDVELRHLFDRMLGAASADDRIGRYPSDVARLRLRRGWPRFLTGDFEGGIDDMRCAAAMFDALSDAIGSAEAYSGLGYMIVLATADSDAASESYERAITSSREAGAPLTTAMALAEQAQSLIFADRAEVRINEMLDEAEALLRAAGDAIGIAHVMMDRTLAAYAVDDLAAAERYADEAIRSSRAGGDVAYEQISYVAKGVVRLHQRDHAGAADCLGLGRLRRTQPAPTRRRAACRGGVRRQRGSTGRGRPTSRWRWRRCGPSSSAVTESWWGVRSANSVCRSRPRWRRVPNSTSAVSVRSPRPSWRSDELTILEAHLS